MNSKDRRAPESRGAGPIKAMVIDGYGGPNCSFVVGRIMGLLEGIPSYNQPLSGA
jgi:hypothetical protein